MNKLVAGQKKTIAIVVLVVLVLSFITFRSNPDFLFKPKQADFSKQKQAFQAQLAKNRAEYEAYLKSVQADPELSKEIFNTLVSEEDVRKEIETQLQTNQHVDIPQVATSSLTIKGSTTKEEVISYFKKNFEDTKSFQDPLVSISRNAYLPFTSTGDLDSAISKTKKFIDGLYAVSVPKAAVAYHASEISTFESYERQLEIAKNNINIAAREAAGPWPAVYREYVIADTHAERVMSQIRALDKEYGTVALWQQTLGDIAAAATSDTRPLAVQLGLVKEANAFLGVADQTFNFEVGSVYEILGDVIGAAVGQFMSQFLDGLISKIEDGLKIVDYLYYNDALLAGRNLPDYFNKYVPDNLDQKIIKSLIPQYNCGLVNKDDLKPLLKQKADEYLGFDRTEDLDLSDPNVYTSIARSGDIPSSEDGEFILKNAVKFAALAEANNAATQELLSPSGKKSARTEDGKNIERTVGGLQSSQTAAMIASLALGTNNSRTLVGNITYNVVSLLLNNFVFKGGTLKTFKEQDRAGCLKGVPELSSIIPASLPPTTPIQVDNALIERCKHSADNCLNLDGGGDILPPPPVEDSAEFTLDKEDYEVGEVPRYKIQAGPSQGNKLIYFARDTNPRSTSDEDIIWKSYEIDGELQQTDENGDWPSKDSSMPWNEAWDCTDIGAYTGLIKIGDTVYQRVYTVADGPSSLCSGGYQIPSR